MFLHLRTQARPRAPKLHVDPAMAEAAQATWLGRMVNEYMSAGVFEALAIEIRIAELGEEPALQCETFAAEERTHGVLCGAVVEALGGQAVAEVAAPRAFPRHSDVSRTEAVLRNLLSISCLSETVAVSLIAAEREEMPEGELRALLTRIWSDEIGHARFGWGLVSRHVPDLDVDARARLCAYLSVAFRHLEQHELSHLPVSFAPPKEGAALGLCSGQDARVLFYETVTDVIVPRLESLGLSAKKAWEARLG